MEHADIAAGERHGIENWTYATEAARTAATGLVAGDVGKIAYQASDDSLWRLKSVSPNVWTAVAPAPAPGGGGSSDSDPYFANVVLLLNMNVPSGSTNTTWIDSSTKNKTNSIYRGANTYIDQFATEATTEYATYMAGSNDGLRIGLAANNNADPDLMFGTTEDFTIEFSWKPSSYGSSAVSLFDSRDAGNLAGYNGFLLRTNSDQANKLVIVHGNIIRCMSEVSMIPGNHYNIVMQRKGGRSILMVNDSTVSWDNFNDFSNYNVGSMVFGGMPGSGVNSPDGRMGPIRVTKGVARYSAFPKFPTA